MSSEEREISKRCQNVRWEADGRRHELKGQEAAFRAAAEALEYGTRYAAKDTARQAANKTSKIWKGDLSPSGLAVMDAILDFADEPFNMALLARYCDHNEKWVATAIHRLRSAGLIAAGSFAVRWDRFGLDHYNEELEARVDQLISSRDDAADGLAWCLPGLAHITLLRAAAFGRPDLSPLNFMLMCGTDHDTWRELSWLRWTGLVKEKTIEVDLAGLDRFERTMKF